MADLDPKQAQALLGEAHTLAALWREPSTFTNADGNPAEPDAPGAIERLGTVLVSNGSILGRGESPESAVADLLAHYIEAT